jgi:lysylphosphatidylglycerol synthetase-like protein (DUF2156 family)
MGSIRVVARVVYGFSAESIVAQIESGEYWDVISEVLTHEWLVTFLTVVGALITASGALAAVTALLTLTKRFYVIALLTCIFSAILGLIVIVGFVGFIVAYLISKRKHEFEVKGPTP